MLAKTRMKRPLFCRETETGGPLIVINCRETETGGPLIVINLPVQTSDRHDHAFLNCFTGKRAKHIRNKGLCKVSELLRISGHVTSIKRADRHK